MVIRYIAFTQCDLGPYMHWEYTTSRQDFSPNEGDRYIPKGKDAKMVIRDLADHQRTFKFENHQCVVRIVNNVVLFESDDAEEIL